MSSVAAVTPTLEIIPMIRTLMDRVEEKEGPGRAGNGEKENAGEPPQPSRLKCSLVATAQRYFKEFWAAMDAAATSVVRQEKTTATATKKVEAKEKGKPENVSSKVWNARKSKTRKKKKKEEEEKQKVETKKQAAQQGKAAGIDCSSSSSSSSTSSGAADKAGPQSSQVAPSSSKGSQQEEGPSVKKTKNDKPWVDVLPQKDLASIPRNFDEFVYNPQMCKDERGKRKPQRALSHAQQSMKFAVEHAKAGSLEEKARMVSQAQPGAPDFLHAIPFENRLVIGDAAYRWNLARYLGSEKAYAQDAADMESCARRSVAAGKGRSHLTSTNSHTHKKAQHVHHCQQGRGGSIHRHDKVVDVVEAMLRDAGVRCKKEPRGVLEHTGQGGPDLLGFSFPEPSTNIALEVAVVNPGQKAFVGPASNVPLFAANKRFQAKFNKYAEATKEADFLNRPLVIEVTGALHGGFQRLIKACANQALRNPESRIHDLPQHWSAATYPQYQRQVLGVAMCNAKYSMVCVHKASYHNRGGPLTSPLTPPGVNSDGRVGANGATTANRQQVDNSKKPPPPAGQQETGKGKSSKGAATIKPPPPQQQRVASQPAIAVTISSEGSRSVHQERTAPGIAVTVGADGNRSVKSDVAGKKVSLKTKTNTGNKSKANNSNNTNNVKTQVPKPPHGLPPSEKSKAPSNNKKQDPVPPGYIRVTDRRRGRDHTPRLIPSPPPASNVVQPNGGEDVGEVGSVEQGVMMEGVEMSGSGSDVCMEGVETLNTQDPRMESSGSGGESPSSISPLE